MINYTQITLVSRGKSRNESTLLVYNQTGVRMTIQQWPVRDIFVRERRRENWARKERGE